MKRFARLLAALSLLIATPALAYPIDYFIPILQNEHATFYGDYMPPADGTITAIDIQVAHFAIGCTQSPVLTISLDGAGCSTPGYVNATAIPVTNETSTFVLQLLPAVPVPFGCAIGEHVHTWAEGCKRPAADINVTIEFTPN